MKLQTLKRNFFQRLLGIPATGKPENENCWSYESGQVIIDLSSTPELAKPAGSIRLEGAPLPVRVLVIRDDEGNFRAYRNQCCHAGRRLDPVPGAGTVQCCSISKGTYDYEGLLIAGPGKGSLKTYPVTVDGDQLIIKMD